MKASRALLLASLCTLALAAVPAQTTAPALYPRQSGDTPNGNSASPTPSGGQSQSQQQPPTSDPPPNNSASETPPSNSEPNNPAPSNPTPSNSQPEQRPSTPVPNEPSTPAPGPSAPASPSLVPIVTKETNSAGDVIEVTKTVLASASSAAPSQSESPEPSPSKGLSTGSIVGMSIAGGVAVIGIVAFFVWKFTRKRITDFDDNEAIKWPELNAHGEQSTYALPTNQTGRAGFGSESDVNLSRTASASTGYVGGADPYAVPPLPHANPNQPYRDDPSAGYYDPYSGPVPHTFSDATAPHDEAIPMSSIRARSPGPGMALETGRASPGPGMAFETGRASPAPSMGRQSPGPYMAYGDPATGRQSPGPRMAYADNTSRAMSPGPNAPYGGGYTR